MPLNDQIRHEETSASKVETPSPQQEVQTSWETHAQNPFNWPLKKKWRQIFAGSLVTFCVGLNSTAIATPGVKIAASFNVDTANPRLDNTVWPIAAWNTGAAFGPMVGIPLLEALGMRTGYLVRSVLIRSSFALQRTLAKSAFKVTYALFFLFVIPQAVAHSFATTIVTRALAGLFGGVLLNCLACFVADMWLTEADRDLGITMFILIYISGVTMGPAFGAIAAVLDWRW